MGQVVSRICSLPTNAVQHLKMLKNVKDIPFEHNGTGDVEFGNGVCMITESSLEEEEENSDEEEDSDEKENSDIDTSSVDEIFCSKSSLYCEVDYDDHFRVNDNAPSYPM
ncbi:hypothetical protein M3Y96_00321100 [Aphelenchoides besseyi]|nr:hypothetical protein M3Y96_00321100 [Aphelenchoides besseyi]